MTSFNSPFTGNVIQPTDVAYRAITLSTNTTLEWPINGNDTNNYAARIMEVTATGAGLSILMPPANQASVGQDALFRNVGSFSFTVRDYDNNSLTTLAPGDAKYIYTTTNSTTAGTWGLVSFGVGTSSVDASVLAGAGLLASGSTLNQSHPSDAIVSESTFGSGDRALTKVWSGGAGNAYFTNAVELGDNWFILLKNNGTGALTVIPPYPQTIDGQATKTFQPNESAIIVSDGSEFLTVGYGVSNVFLFTALVKPVTSGAYTLTANEASNVIQQYTGTLTGNVTVTYPPVVNLYVVSNQTTAGGYTLTLTTGISGGANAVIAAGQQATLVCDGTNFYNANTTQAGATSLSIISGTAASPAINFSAEPDTGIYRPGANQWGVSVSSNLIFTVTATGVNIAGSGTFTNGVSGGTF